MQLKELPETITYKLSESFTIDYIYRSVIKNGVTIRLEDVEWRFLICFLRHRGEVIPNKTFWLEAFGQDFCPMTNTVQVYVCKLRRKLGKELFKLIRGVGYRMVI